MGRRRKRKGRSDKSAAEEDAHGASCQISSSSDKVECLNWNGQEVVDTLRPQSAPLSIAVCLTEEEDIMSGSLAMKSIWQSLQSIDRLHISPERGPTSIQRHVWPKLLPLALFDDHNRKQSSSVAMKCDPDQVPSSSANITATTTTTCNQHLVAMSETGSGKTLAYALPLVYRAMTSSMTAAAPQQQYHESGLILAPTRELAIQIGKNVKAVVKGLRHCSCRDGLSELRNSRVNLVTLYGASGDKKKEQDNQVQSLANNPGILVSTTGRLLDVLQSSSSSSSAQTSNEDDAERDIDQQPSKQSTIANFMASVTLWVIDEADRMAMHTDLSQQIDQILRHIPRRAIRVFASATWPNDTRKWKEWIWGNDSDDAIERNGSKDKSVSSCLVIRVNPKALQSTTAKMGPRQEVANADGSCNEKVAADDTRKEIVWSDIPSNITQTVHVCADHKKPRKLMNTLNKIPGLVKKPGDEHVLRQRPLCIVFFGTIKTLQYCHKLLLRDRLVCVQLHSHMPQQVREQNIVNFTSGKTPILLATDVAARGIHVSSVRAVIQYDFPGNIDQYIHRCGVSVLLYRLFPETRQRQCCM